MRRRRRGTYRPQNTLIWSLTLLLGFCILIICAIFLENNGAFTKVPTVADGSVPAGISPPSESPPESGFTQPSDPLLVLVNSEHPLPDDWQSDLVYVDEEVQVDSRMYDDLTAMFAAAEEDEVWFWVASGYRSVESQQIILDRGVARREGEGMTPEEALEDALRSIQRPGYSEHHTGLAIDLNDVSDDFENTEAYRWLSAHGSEYGFVQRYRRDKADVTGIDNESWHYRYVGKEHAQEMERLNMCLEEYVEYLSGNP